MRPANKSPNGQKERPEGRPHSTARPVTGNSLAVYGRTEVKAQLQEPCSI